MNNKKSKPKKKKFIIIFIMILIAISGFIIINSDIFYIKNIIVEDNLKLGKDYIKEKTEVDSSDNIFLIDLKQIKEILEKEIYIKTVNIKRKFPDELIIMVEERKGRISYDYRYKKYLLDVEGILLEEIKKPGDFFNIESRIKTNIKFGDKLTLENSKIKFEKVLSISQYIYNNNKNLNCNILLKDDNMYCIIEKNTFMKLDLTKNLNYQYEFGIDIIETRIMEGENINGVIDFTKGNNPIYTDFTDLEEEI